MITFSERIQARKTNGFWNSPEAKWTTKLNTKELARQLEIPCPELFCTADRPEDLPARDPAVYKANCGWSGKRVCVYVDGVDLLHKQARTRDDLCRFLADEKGQGPARGFLIEEAIFLRGGLAHDVKVFSFNGINALVWYKDHSAKTHHALSPDWMVLPSFLTRFGKDWTTSFERPPRPAGLDDALKWASRVTQHLGTFLRVDFLEADSGCFLVELTPCPNGGRNFTAEANLWLGGYWQYCGVQK